MPSCALSHAFCFLSCNSSFFFSKFGQWRLSNTLSTSISFFLKKKKLPLVKINIEMATFVTSSEDYSISSSDVTEYVLKNETHTIRITQEFLNTVGRRVVQFSLLNGTLNDTCKCTLIIPKGQGTFVDNTHTNPLDTEVVFTLLPNGMSRVYIDIISNHVYVHSTKIPISTLTPMITENTGPNAQTSTFELGNGPRIKDLVMTSESTQTIMLESGTLNGKNIGLYWIIVSSESTTDGDDSWGLNLNLSNVLPMVSRITRHGADGKIHVIVPSTVISISARIGTMVLFCVNLNAIMIDIYHVGEL